MEADWEVEIAPDAPVIDASWEGRLDLRRAPHLAADLPESRQFPPLTGALAALNSAASPVWTSKCDVWAPGELDPDELDAPPAEAACTIACYIDLLPARDGQWPLPEQAVASCRALCARLHNMPLRCCRADLIVRRASIAPHRQDLGITAYIAACGSTLDAARARLASAVQVLVDMILRLEPPENPAAKIQ